MQVAAPKLVGVQTYGVMDPETRVLPTEYLGDKGRIDLVLLEQQIEDLLLPELLERLGVDARKCDERAVSREHAVGHQLLSMLTGQREQWCRGARAYCERVDLYSLVDRASDAIIARAERTRAEAKEG